MNSDTWRLTVYRLLRDAELFDARLGKINGFGDIGKNVIDTVKAKSVAEKTTPLPAAAAAAPDPTPASASAVASDDTKRTEQPKEEATKGGVPTTTENGTIEEPKKERK